MLFRAVMSTRTHAAQLGVYSPPALTVVAQVGQTPAGTEVPPLEVPLGPSTTPGPKPPSPRQLAQEATQVVDARLVGPPKLKAQLKQLIVDLRLSADRQEPTLLTFVGPVASGKAYAFGTVVQGVAGDARAAAHYGPTDLNTTADVLVHGSGGSAPLGDLLPTILARSAAAADHCGRLFLSLDDLEHLPRPKLVDLASQLIPFLQSGTLSAEGVERHFPGAVLGVITGDPVVVEVFEAALAYARTGGPAAQDQFLRHAQAQGWVPSTGEGSGPITPPMRKRLADFRQIQMPAPTVDERVTMFRQMLADREERAVHVDPGLADLLAAVSSSTGLRGGRRLLGQLEDQALALLEARRHALPSNHVATVTVSLLYDWRSRLGERDPATLQGTELPVLLHYSSHATDAT